MKLLLIGLLILLMSTIAIAQQNNKTTFYAEIGYNKVFNTESPSIKNFPHTVSRWKALDGNKFGADEKDKPLYYRLPLSIELGFAVETNKENSVAVSLSYNHFGRKDTLGSKLRYSDQVDHPNGFVKPSYYSLTSGYHLYRTLGLYLDYLFADGIGSYNHRLGFGFGVQRVLGSRYFLNHVKYPSGEYSDFTNTDLSLDDKIWLFNPAISYHSNVYNSEKLNYWLVSSFAFNVQEKRKKEPLGHLLRIGIRVELK